MPSPRARCFSFQPTCFPLHSRAAKTFQVQSGVNTKNRGAQKDEGRRLMGQRFRQIHFCNFFIDCKWMEIGETEGNGLGTFNLSSQSSLS